MPVNQVSPSEFLKLGLSYVGFEEHRQENANAAANVVRFRSTFGVDPETCSSILVDLQEEVDVNGKTIMKNPRASFLLMALYWMRSYNTEIILSGIFRRQEKTVRKYLRMYVNSIQALALKKVKHTSTTEILMLATDKTQSLFYFSFGNLEFKDCLAIRRRTL